MHYPSPDALLDPPSDEAYVSSWVTIDQERITAFADATDDQQWIHVDTERAASGPFGGTIAHGFLTLSLLPRLIAGALEVDGVAMHVNAGLDRVRFTSPVRSGQRVRARTTLRGAERTMAGIRAALSIIVEIDGADRPALIAEQLVLLVPEES